MFRGVGYERNRWARLRDDLKELARTADFVLANDDEFGRRFYGRGHLATPSGQPLRLVTVWLIRSEGGAPRLITAYPADD